MKIPIDEGFRIKGTERCWELQRVRSHLGSRKWEPYKWFPTFRQALAYAVQREIRIHPASTIAEAIDAVSGIVRKYEQLIPSEFKITDDLPK